MSRRSARLSAASATGTSQDSEAMPPPPTPPVTTQRGRKRKATLSSEEAASAPPPPDATAPSTPAKRRTTKTAVAPPPPTPTPSAVGLIAEGTASGKSAPKSKRSKSTPRATRLADPLATNAPLISPETSRVVEAKRLSSPVSPTKTAARSKPSAATTTTANLLEEACAHLVKVDKRMKALIDAHPCRIFSPEGLAEKIDPFESLASGIISQQVSGAAARSIKRKFVGLFEDGAAAEGEVEIDIDTQGRFPHPSEVAACSLEMLRTAGLSQRKAEYIQGLAEKFASGELSAQMLADAPYEEVVEKLVAVRGLGRWSVEMFACFALKRMDVFSLGDLGVQRGMAAFVGRDVAKLKNKGGKWKYMSEKEMEEISSRFAPYRSLFMWYMWRAESVDVSTLE